MKIYKESRSTVRGVGFVEVVYVQQTRSSGQYEIGLTWARGIAQKNPACQFADTLAEAMRIQADLLMDLILFKQMARSFN